MGNALWDTKSYILNVGMLMILLYWFPQTSYFSGTSCSKYHAQNTSCLFACNYSLECVSMISLQWPCQLTTGQLIITQVFENSHSMLTATTCFIEMLSGVHLCSHERDRWLIGSWSRTHYWSLIIPLFLCWWCMFTGAKRFSRIFEHLFLEHFSWASAATPPPSVNYGATWNSI